MNKTIHLIQDSMHDSMLDPNAGVKNTKTKKGRQNAGRKKSGPKTLKIKYAYLILGSLIFVRGLMWVSDLVKAERFMAAGALAVGSFGIWLALVIYSRRLHLKGLQERTRK